MGLVSNISLGVLITLICLFVLTGAKEDRKVVKVGGIFHKDHHDAQIAFKYAIDKVNLNLQKLRIESIIYTTPFTNSFKTSKVVCELAAKGVTAIFGPEYPESRGIVESICQTLKIPNFQTSWYSDSSDEDIPNSMVINFFPSQQSLSEGIKSLITDYDWKSFTILYENDVGLVRLQEIIKMHGPHDSPITVRQLTPGQDNRRVLREIKESGEDHFILDCASENIIEYLKQANQVNLLDVQQSYFLTSLDAHTIDIDELNKFSQSNITCLRMLDPTSNELKTISNVWNQGEARNGKDMDIQPESVRLSVALMNDAVKLFGAVVQELDSNIGANTQLSEPMNLSLFPGNQNKSQNIKAPRCDEPSTWQGGPGVMNYKKILQTISNGLSGKIKFDPNGQRKEFILDIAELSKTGFNQIGLWHSDDNFINITRSESDVITIQAEKWQNKTFIITSRIGAPYLMHRDPDEGEFLLGNDRFEGYSLDLIDAISKIVGFQYEFKLVDDGKYGSYDKNLKKWNGMIGELQDGRADLAICDMTITEERRKVVDFTVPFMNTGISILYTKPIIEPFSFASFLEPFTFTVWGYIGAAYICVSLVMFIVARMAAREWENSHLYDSDNQEHNDSLSLGNCIWIATGSLFQQGCNTLPTSFSSRLVTGMWWFFALIIVSSYTAGLTTMRMTQKMYSPIENVEDLVKTKFIKFGAVTGGSTAAFFRNSELSLYKRMWEEMQAYPAVFSNSNDDGIQRVIDQKGHYAFLMESTSLEYIVERSCELAQIGGLLDNKGYGIGIPQNAVYRTAVNGAVLKLMEAGTLASLKAKWWKSMNGGGSCADNLEDSVSKEFGMDSLGGIFLILSFGCGIAFLIAAVEFFCNVQKVVADKKISMGEALKSECRIVMSGKMAAKTVESSSMPENSAKKSSNSGKVNKNTSSTIV